MIKPRWADGTQQRPIVPYPPTEATSSPSPMDPAQQTPSPHRDAVLHINSDRPVKNPIVQMVELRKITGFKVGSFDVEHECDIKDGNNNTATVFLQHHDNLVQRHYLGDAQVSLSDGCVVILRKSSPVQFEDQTR